MTDKNKDANDLTPDLSNIKRPRGRPKKSQITETIQQTTTEQNQEPAHPSSQVDANKNGSLTNTPDTKKSRGRPKGSKSKDKTTVSQETTISNDTSTAEPTSTTTPDTPSIPIQQEESNNTQLPDNTIYYVKYLDRFSLKILKDLLWGRLQALKVVGKEFLIIPSRNAIVHTLYSEPKVGRYLTIASRVGKPVLPWTIAPEKETKWDLSLNKGLTFLLSWPLLKFYKGSIKGISKVIQIIYLTIQESIKVAPITPIKIEILDLTIYLIRDENNNFFLTKFKGDPWRISPWLTIQLALLLLNLYPLLVTDLSKIAEEKSRILVQWYWDYILVSIPILPPHYIITPQKYKEYYTNIILSPELAVLHLLIDYFSQDNERTQEYYENLQVILLIFEAISTPGPGYNINVSESADYLTQRIKIIASITKPDFSDDDKLKIEKLAP